MGPLPERTRQLLERRSRGDEVAAVAAVVLWALVWVTIFAGLGDTAVRWLGLTGAWWVAAQVVAPALLTGAWVAFLAARARAFVRRRRRVREEFSE